MIGEIIEVDQENRAEISLTIEAEDGEVFEETFDCMFNQARAINFENRYGFYVTDDGIVGNEVEVSTDGAPWPDWYHVCILD